MVNLYYKGKQLTKDDESIGNLCNWDQWNLVMVSISMTDSLANDHKKIEERIINKLTGTCQLHKGDKELNVCVTCGFAFCDQCAAEHQTHTKINRNDLLKYSEELRQEKEKIQKSFMNMNLFSSYSDMDICKEQRDEWMLKCDQLTEMTNNIKKRCKLVFCDFKSDFDSIFPYLVEYKEKVEIWYEESRKESTVRIEKDFIDFYCKYMNSKSYSTKWNDIFENLQFKIDTFQGTLIDTIAHTQKIIDAINEQFHFTKDHKMIDDYSTVNNGSLNHLNLANFYSTNGLGQNTLNNTNPIVNCGKYPASEMKTKNISANNFGKMNWVTLWSSNKDKKAYVKSMENNIRDKKNNSFSNIQNRKSSKVISLENRIEEGIEESVENDSRYIYNTVKGSNNLICFNKDSKKLTQIKCELSKSIFKKFESYHSTLNYKNHFYISGGYTTNRMFYKYNRCWNEFIRLPDMLSGHSYHCLLGVGDSIFAITGFKNKKVEKFDMMTQVWTSMPELELSRSWPSCISMDDKYIFLFGGLFEVSKGPEENKACSMKKHVVKLNIENNSPNNTWEAIEVQAENDLPFYWGVLKMNNEQILLLGGKYDPKEDNIDTCFNYSYTTNTVCVDRDFKLPNKDEFDGNLFIDLGNSVFGQFSSIYFDTFYLVNIGEKAIDVIKGIDADSVQ